MKTLRVEAGRTIVRVSDDAALYTLHKVGNDVEGYAVSPTEADQFVRTLVRAVNAHEGLVEALKAIQDRCNDLEVGDYTPYRTSAYLQDISDIVHAALELAKEEG